MRPSVAATGRPIGCSRRRAWRAFLSRPLLGRRRQRFLGARRAHEQAAEPGERRALLAARHDHVDHAVTHQVFGALEAFRQPLADRLLDHPLAGEADDRAGFGEMDVAEHGVGGGDAAGRRIGEDDDIGQAAARRRRTATVARGICISANMPSCIRAPPEAVNMTKGVRRSSAWIIPAMIASPAAMPRQPPWKAKSCTAIVTSSPSSGRARASPRRNGRSWRGSP